MVARAMDRYHQLIAQAPELEALIDRDRREQPLAPLLLPGSSPALAAAELQQRLQELAAAHDVRVLSLRVRSTERDGSFERIAIEARMQSKMPGLRDLLNEIEQGTPYLFVETLSVRSRPQRRRGAPSTSALEARLVVSGLRLPTPLGGGPLSAEALR